MRHPKIIKGPAFDWEDAREAVANVVSEEGEVNWKAAACADPGVTRCPSCDEYFWAEAYVVGCPDCGVQWRPFAPHSKWSLVEPESRQRGEEREEMSGKAGGEITAFGLQIDITPEVQEAISKEIDRRVEERLLQRRNTSRALLYICNFEKVEEPLRSKDLSTVEFSGLERYQMIIETPRQGFVAQVPISQDLFAILMRLSELDIL